MKGGMICSVSYQSQDLGAEVSKWQLSIKNFLTTGVSLNWKGPSQEAVSSPSLRIFKQ